MGVPGGVGSLDEQVHSGHAQGLPGEATSSLRYLMVNPRRHVQGPGRVREDEARA